jgi:hypothetical protein
MHRPDPKPTARASRIPTHDHRGQNGCPNAGPSWGRHHGIRSTSHQQAFPLRGDPED